MSAPSDEMRLRALLEQTIATGNAAIIERDRLAVINAKLLEALRRAVVTMAYACEQCPEIRDDYQKVSDAIDEVIKQAEETK
jgi:23S rRNA A2030 N6-methylase RlmJ